MKYCKLFKFIIVIALVPLLVSCGILTRDSEIKRETNVVENGKVNITEEEQKQADRKSQTLWSVLDKEGNEKEMLLEDNKDIKDIIKIITEQCAIIDNRDYGNLGVEEEYQYYSDNFIKTLKNSEYKLSVQEMYENSKLVLEEDELTWYRSYLNEEYTTCKVTVDGGFKVKEASEEYLSKNGMDLATIYREKRVYYLEKKDNKWQIYNIEKGILSKQ